MINGYKDEISIGGNMENVADFLRLHAQTFPEKSALVAPTGNGQWKTLTYGELNALVDAYAHGFKAQGIARGDRVLFLVKLGCQFLNSLTML